MECHREQRTAQVSAMEMVRYSEETYMDLTTLLIIVLILAPVVWLAATSQ